MRITFSIPDHFAISKNFENVNEMVRDFMKKDPNLRKISQYRLLEYSRSMLARQYKVTVEIDWNSFVEEVKNERSC